MKYTYQAVDAKGRKRSGALEAGDEAEALALLRAQKLVPTQLKEAGRFRQADANARGDAPKSIWEVEVLAKDIHKEKFSRKKLIVLFTQLSVMLRAGVTLSMALEVAGAGETNRKLRRILRELHNDLMGGVALSYSMAKFACFDSVTVNLVRAGEADGHLERSFIQITQVNEKQHALQSKIISASIYPAILLVLVIGVVGLLNALVMPSFVELFDALDTELPASTAIIMKASVFLNSYWWVFVLIVVALVALYVGIRRKNEKAALAIDRFKLRIPLVGKLIRQSGIARFSRVLSVLLESGQDFLSALQIARSVITNKYLVQGIGQVGDDVRVGNSISVSMQKHDFFEPVYVSMLRAGEESGSLSDTLAKMADMYETETDATTKRLTTMMEPLITVLIAGVVGVVVVAIVIPMFSMFDLVGNI